MKRVVLYPSIFLALAPAQPVGGYFYQPPGAGKFPQFKGAALAQFGSGIGAPAAAAAVSTVALVSATDEPFIVGSSVIVSDVNPPAFFTQPESLRPQFTADAIVTQTSVVLSESAAPSQPFVVAAAQPYGAFPQDPIKISYGFPAKLMQDGSDLAPFQPFVASVFAQSPERFKAPLRASLQWDGADFAVQGTITTVRYGAFPQYPDIFIKPFKAALQWEAADFAAQGTIVSVFYGWQYQWPDLFVKRFPAHEQRFGDFAPAGFISVAFQQPYVFAQSTGFFIRPFCAGYESSTPITVTAVTPFAAFSASALPIKIQYVQYQANNLVTPAAVVVVQPYNAFSTDQPFASFTRTVSDGLTGAVFIPSTPFVGAQDPIKVTYGFPAKLQWDASDFSARGTIVSTTPQGWMFQSPERFGIKFNAAQQRFQDFTPAGFIPVAAIYTQGWYHQWPDLFGKKVAAAQQRFQDFTPAGTIVSVTPQGWWGQSPWLFAKAFPAALAWDAPDFPPQFITPQFTAALFKQWPECFIAPYKVSLQRFGDAAPQSYQFTAATWAQWPERFVKPLSAAQQRFQDFTPAWTIVSVFYGMWNQWPDLFAKGFPAKLQWDASDFAPAGTIVSVTPQGWWGQSPVLFWKPTLPAYEQRFGDFAPAGFIPVAAIYTQGWYYQWPDLFGKKVAAAQQRFADFAPAGTIVSVTPQGWWGQPPALFWRATYPAFRQQDGSDFTPFPAPTFAPFVQPPTAFWKASYPAFRQQAAADFPPRTPVVAAPPLVSYEGAVVVRYTSFILAETLDAAPRPPVITVTPTEFPWSQSPDIFRRPFPAKLQRFADLPVQRFVFAATPTFFSWTYSPVVFIKPFPAKLQMFSTRGTFTPIAPPPEFMRGAVQWPVLFKARFPVVEQQFEGWTPFGVFFEIISGEGMKNEIERVRWLSGSLARVRYMKNEIERRRSMPRPFTPPLTPTPGPIGWMGGDAWSTTVKVGYGKLTWLYRFGSYLQ